MGLVWQTVYHIKSAWVWQTVYHIKTNMGLADCVSYKFNTAWFGRLSSVTQAPIHDEDYDVALERKRVLKGNGKYDVLCLENLTKVRLL